jgi:tRNA-modifying protein YgfZ
MTETNWQTTFKALGAVYKNDVIQHFGDAARELQQTQTNNIICNLSHLGLLTLTGNDAVSFLQGQVTNDVKALDGHIAHFSAYCTPKGRMLALFLAFAHNQKLYLQFNQSLLPAVMKRLKMYVLRAKVEITDASKQMIRFGIHGPDALTILQKQFSNIPSQNFATSPIEQDENPIGLIIKLPSIDGHQRFEVIIDETYAYNTFNILKDACELVGKPCWDWLDIQAGIPDVTEQTQEQFVPQMLNLDILNGINFKKGCYTGQEIVARTHYLGTVKRRTYKASIQSETQPNAGDKITDNQQNEVGQIVKVTQSPELGFDALIEMRIEAKEANNAYWQQCPIVFGSLPYSLDTNISSA